MTPARINVVLWIAFAIMSATVFTIGRSGEAMDRIPLFVGAGAIDAVLAVALLWQNGVSLAVPVVIAVYFFTNYWLLFYLFLSVVFWDYKAP